MQSVKEVTLPRVSEFTSTLWLTLCVDQRQITLMKISEEDGSLAFGEYFPNEDVSGDIIGHWVEVIGHYDQVLYRRFVHNKFPLFPASQVHKGRNNLRTQVQIELPKLPQANYICLWEQAYRSITDRHPSKQEILLIPLTRELAQAV